MTVCELYQRATKGKLRLKHKFSKAGSRRVSRQGWVSSLGFSTFPAYTVLLFVLFETHEEGLVNKKVGYKLLDKEWDAAMLTDRCNAEEGSQIKQCSCEL